MKQEISGNHPIRQFFGEAVHVSVSDRLGMSDASDAEAYLVALLVDFLHRDGVYSVRDAFGQRVTAITDMLAEGDVLVNADSFAREREVHRHIGDFVLFWSGLFPEFIDDLRRPGSKDALIDVERQGPLSYHLVSTFNFPPYDQEAPLFGKLSSRFEEFREALRLIRSSLPGLAA